MPNFIHYCSLKIVETIDVMAFDISDNEPSNILVLQETENAKENYKTNRCYAKQLRL